MQQINQQLKNQYFFIVLEQSQPSQGQVQARFDFQL